MCDGLRRGLALVLVALAVAYAPGALAYDCTVATATCQAQADAYNTPANVAAGFTRVCRTRVAGNKVDLFNQVHGVDNGTAGTFQCADGPPPNPCTAGHTSTVTFGGDQSGVASYCDGTCTENFSYNGVTGCTPPLTGTCTTGVATQSGAQCSTNTTPPPAGDAGGGQQGDNGSGGEGGHGGSGGSSGTGGGAGGAGGQGGAGGAGGQGGEGGKGGDGLDCEKTPDIAACKINHVQGGQDCDHPPAFTSGDSGTEMIAYQAWRAACAAGTITADTSNFNLGINDENQPGYGKPTPEDSEMHAMYDDFGEKVQNVPLIQAANGFFAVSLSGSCPQLQIPSTPIWSHLDPNLLCSGVLSQLLAWAGYALMAVAAFAALRIAIY